MPSPLPLGLYEQVLTDRLAGLLSHLDADKLQAELADLDPAEAPKLLARHVAAAVDRALSATTGDHAVANQVELVNAVLRLIDTTVTFKADAVAAEGRALYAVRRRDELVRTRSPRRPLIPLSATDLLVNGEREPRVGSQIAAELESADAVDLLCAFIRWEGLRVLRDPLGELRERGVALRVITTTYMGVTQRRALDELVALGAEVRVAYEQATTRLHAKAWLLRRSTGYSTAYVGSSNLSRSALLNGIEWNVRLSQVETPAVLDKFRATFEEYWASELFEPYDPERFDREVAAVGKPAVDFALLDIRATAWQQQVLYQLDVERQRHGRWHNLVVGATGTGKTMLAALDYRRLRTQLGNDATLLFVAHRRELLQQSAATFRAVLRDPTFGELLVGGRRPGDWRHVFASIQSLAALGLEALPPDHFAVVIIDEAHHVPAVSYRELLQRLAPRVLLGLTATPERADGQDITVWFGGRFAAELRVWTAIEEGSLCPFQYFGVADGVDLSHLSWERGGYVASELDAVFTGNDARVRIVLHALQDLVDDVATMRALGFCVSVAHARFMADQFVRAGIAAEAVSAQTPSAERDAVLRRLRGGQTAVVFSVDLFNEGLDIPEVDTILLLRPTESATVFLQQLGRGLRQAEGKAVCTVIDLVGQQRREFRWDLRLRALTGETRAGVLRHAEAGFPFLPPGCALTLDRVASEHVLSSLRSSLRITAANLEAELRRLGDVDLATFLRETVLEPEDLYRRERWWSALRRRSGLRVAPAGPDESGLARGLPRLLHIDDRERLARYGQMLTAPEAPNWSELPDRDRRLVRMLLWDLLDDAADPSAQLKRLWGHPALRHELGELLAVLDEAAPHLSRPLAEAGGPPLAVHARYSVRAALAALDVPDTRIASFREGVLWDDAANVDAFFVTLRKTDRDYSPTTMYRDYAISPTLFHWESQSTTAGSSPTGQRYLAGTSTVLLFARESKTGPSGTTAAYLFLGPATIVSSTGDRPMAVTWRLRHSLPPDFFATAKVAAG